jgi:hypothetical protein
MRRSPRLRRLESDWSALLQLRADSNVFDFVTPQLPLAGPPEAYLVRLAGPGLWQPQGAQQVLLREGHEILVRLGAAYPRMIPELVWQTPIFHPNISAHGTVCLGGYSTHWAPSLQLDELCALLWDIARYANYDAASPYNRAAAAWVRTQTAFSFPLDPRPLRDRAPGQADRRGSEPRSATAVRPPGGDPLPPGTRNADPTVVEAELVFLDEPRDAANHTAADRQMAEEVVPAEIVPQKSWIQQPGPRQTGTEARRPSQSPPIRYIR